MQKPTNKDNIKAILHETLSIKYCKFSLSEAFAKCSAILSNIPSSSWLTIVSIRRRHLRLLFLSSNTDDQNFFSKPVSKQNHITDKVYLQKAEEHLYLGCSKCIIWMKRRPVDAKVIKSREHCGPGHSRVSMNISYVFYIAVKRVLNNTKSIKWVSGHRRNGVCAQTKTHTHTHKNIKM